MHLEMLSLLEAILSLQYKVYYMMGGVQLSHIIKLLISLKENLSKNL